MTTSQLVSGLVVANAVASMLCTFYAVCAINGMSSRTKLSLWLAFIGQAMGWFCQFLAAIDYFHGDALGWPWFLIAGVLLANVGTASIFLTNRRQCSCSGCPARRPAGFVPCEQEKFDVIDESKNGDVHIRYVARNQEQGK